MKKIACGMIAAVVFLTGVFSTLLIQKVTMKPDYYSNIDYYNLKPTKDRSMIPHFKTYQQTTSYTCGVSNIRMMMDNYGFDKENKYDEMTMADLTDTTEEGGVSALYLSDFLQDIGWHVELSVWGKKKFDNPDNPDAAYEEFKDWARNNIDAGHPVMVDWNDWGGHWQSIIGFDTMGTDSINDDVIIFADPFDTTDHNEDGYYVYPALRFFAMWTDSGVDMVGGNPQQYLIAYPGV